MNFTKIFSFPNIKLPVAYKGTECVKKPPAATTQRVWRRRTSNLALSGVSKFDPLEFLTGANSSSRTTYIDKIFRTPVLDRCAFSCYWRVGSIVTSTEWQLPQIVLLKVYKGKHQIWIVPVCIPLFDHELRGFSSLRDDNCNHVVKTCFKLVFQQ